MVSLIDIILQPPRILGTSNPSPTHSHIHNLGKWICIQMQVSNSTNEELYELQYPKWNMQNGGHQRGILPNFECT